MSKALSYTQANNPTRLYDELLAAIPALAPTLQNGVLTATLLLSSNGTALTLTVPDALDATLIAPVLAAHSPTPPLVYTGLQHVEKRVTTVGTTPQELFRATLASLTGYPSTVTLVGFDRANGDARYILATVMAKRLGAGAVLVNEVGGATAKVLADHRDGAAGAWAITPSVSGSDFVITVSGATGRTVDWFCALDVRSFTPAGA